MEPVEGSIAQGEQAVNSVEDDLREQIRLGNIVIAQLVAACTAALHDLTCPPQHQYFDTTTKLRAAIREAI